MEHTIHADIVFKQVKGVDIALDVHAWPGPELHPALLYFHGGALISGAKPAPGVLLERCREWGYALVSANYRLAPEARWPAFRDDVVDAWRWVREQGARYGIDPERVGVCGGSAGGYLALLVGAVAEPRPRAVISFWGYGDLAAPWANEPDAFYLGQPLEEEARVREAVRGEVLTEGTDPLRGAFYRFCRQNGLWPREVVGCDPRECPEVFDAACPERQVTPEYPPTFLMHGTADTDVPVTCADTMHAALRAAGVSTHYARMEGGPHGLWGVTPDWAGTDERQVRAAFEDLRAFLAEHLG